MLLWNQVDALQKHLKKDQVHMRLWTRLYGMSGYGSVNYEHTPKFYVAVHLVDIARVHDIISYFLAPIFRNVAEALVSKGLCTVLRYRQDDDQRSAHYDELLAAETRAIKNLKGLHSKKEQPLHRVADLSGVCELISIVPYIRMRVIYIVVISIGTDWVDVLSKWRCEQALSYIECVH